MSLEPIGWNAALSSHFANRAEEGFTAARVSLEHAGGYLLLTERGELPAVITGNLRYTTDNQADLPAVGDWVVIRDHGEMAAIHAVLPRHGLIARKEAGRRARAQVLAANVDTALLLMGLDQNFNLRRLERALAMVGESGASPVVILTKADLCPDLSERLAETTAIARHAPVHAISTTAGSGLAAVWSYLEPGRTLVLLGSSGAGKSTLLNALLGEEVMRTRAVRVTDDHGRHTTTHRQLFRLPCDAMIIDTPGLREFALWGDGDGIAEVFPEITALAADCRFSDCRHEGEPGCAVQQALDTGALDPAHFENYRKLQRELAYLVRKTDVLAERAERDRWKQIIKEHQRTGKNRSRGKQ